MIATRTSPPAGTVPIALVAASLGTSRVRRVVPALRPARPDPAVEAARPAAVATPKTQKVASTAPASTSACLIGLRCDKRRPPPSEQCADYRGTSLDWAREL